MLIIGFTQNIRCFNSQKDVCSQVVCVKSSAVFEYYKKGYEVYSNISDTKYWEDGTYVLDVLQGTKCDKNSVRYTLLLICFYCIVISI